MTVDQISAKFITKLFEENNIYDDMSYILM